MKGTDIMRIAVTYENGNVFQHFGHSEQFKIYDVEDGKILNSEIVPADGDGHGMLAGFLSDKKIDVLICGGIGAGAQNALSEAGIKLYGGISGGADNAVNALIAGNLDCNDNIQCSGHNHSHGHHVGHSCGENRNGCSGNGCHS